MKDLATSTPTLSVSCHIPHLPQLLPGNWTTRVTLRIDIGAGTTKLAAADVPGGARPGRITVPHWPEVFDCSRPTVCRVLLFKLGSGVRTPLASAAP